MRLNSGMGLVNNWLLLKSKYHTVLCLVCTTYAVLVLLQVTLALSGEPWGGQCCIYPTDGVCNWIPLVNNLLITYHDELWHASINKGLW